MRDGFGLPSMAEQEKALRAHGFTDKDFKPTGFVYTDRKKYKSHREASTKWLDMLEKQVRPGDVIYVHSPVVFAAGERSIRERLTFLHSKKVAGVFDCSIGKMIKLTPDSAAVLDFQERGAAQMQNAKAKKMTKRRLAVGYGPGFSPWTDKDKRAAKQAWLSIDPNATNAELEAEASRLAGRDRIPYRTIFNWANPKPTKLAPRPRAWPERGSHYTKPRKKRR